MTVITRFAPSPTGYLHVGGVRTALFSWLYAKHHQGKFILRVEDTDQTRSTQASVEAILDGLAWLGLDADEGPIFQTKRYDRYQAVAQQLLEEGKAYRCYCSQERLTSLRESQLEAKQKPRYDGHCRHQNLPEKIGTPFVIRFKNPQSGQVVFDDAVYGTIRVNNEELDDLIIIRSDGYPTYNFAVVIDDADMRISHVIRGDDHINNTPRQINLFNALNVAIPIFAHLPMILGEDGKRLSKRHGAVNILEFKKEGVLPHALLNYLVRLGWSYGDQEIFSIQDMIEHFDLNKVSRGAAIFGYEKLYWLNQHYQKSDSPIKVADYLKPQCLALGLDLDKGPSLVDLVSVQAERCKTLKEMAEKSRYFYDDEVIYDEAAIQKHFKPQILAPLQSLFQCFENLSSFSADEIQNCINQVIFNYEIGMGKLAQPLRIAVTGSTMSPSIDKTLALIGKERSLRRLDFALKHFFLP